ncbi:DUF3131 domain-containing protein [Photobacterium minamisatsumaniensis]|uniref:DUF3131 domain-containing protein n=1 Tax=Photobacterium minamisatsumaniensis TaxID=2910233 RepID=UPI003D12EA52
MAKGFRHSLIVQCLLFFLLFSSSSIQQVWASTDEEINSETAPITKTNEDTSPSFYGSRAVTQDMNQAETVKVEFQRRSIAPPIIDGIAITDETLPLTKSPLNLSVVEESKVNDKQSPSLNTLLPIPLSRKELLLANKAKYYIERNWNKETGLIDSVQGYHHSTMWDVASGIAAILSLEGIGLMTSDEASQKISRTLTTLETLPLYDNRLPNREYSTLNGKPSGRYSNSSSNGNGWSALDVGRLLIWLEITTQHKPQFTKQITAIKNNWQLSEAIFNKTLYGELKTSKKNLFRQEGRLGYLQYAAQGFRLAGFDVNGAYKIRNISPEIIDDELFFIDKRNLPYFTTDPYVLNAIEMGQENAWWDQLDSLFTLQKNKSGEEKQLWVFAEDAMNKAPWFSYNNIFIYGRSWVSTSPGGKPVENPQIFSNKVAQGLSVLYPEDPFSQTLHNQVVDNSLSYRSVPTGLYENSATNTAFNINTNSLILASLWFKHRNYIPLILVK